MADDSVVNSGNSPEAIAFKLLYEVAHAEGKELRNITGRGKADRGWILNTYRDCLDAMRPRPQSK